MTGANDRLLDDDDEDEDVLDEDVGVLDATAVDVDDELRGETAVKKFSARVGK